MIRFFPQKEGRERSSLDPMPLCERARGCDVLPNIQVEKLSAYETRQE